MQLNKLLLLLFVPLMLFAKECSPYFNPNRFIQAPEYVDTLFQNKDISNNSTSFSIERKELYRYTYNDIATEINENFSGLWRDWIEDAYTMTLVPEQVLLKYKNFYLSLNVTISGVQGDATKLKRTTVKYNFYNYTKQVKKHIACKKGKK